MTIFIYGLKGNSIRQFYEIKHFYNLNIYGTQVAMDMSQKIEKFDEIGHDALIFLAIFF